MKLSISLPVLFVLVASSTASAQIINGTPTIADSVAIPSLPSSLGVSSGGSFPTPVESSIIGSPVPAEGYVGDLGQSGTISGSIVSQPSVISGDSVGVSQGSAGEVVNLGVISEAQESSLGSGGAAGLGGGARTYGRPDLFYNYYTQGNSNRANAQMYMSPHPVPPNVGHTFYTYQPFHPEEYLYWHKNKFHNYYDNGRGYNRTRALYYSPPIKQAVSNIYWNKIRLPR